MAGQSIPSTAPDVEAWLIQTFAASVAPAIVRNVKPPQIGRASCRERV